MSIFKVVELREKNDKKLDQWHRWWPGRSFKNINLMCVRGELLDWFSTKMQYYQMFLITGWRIDHWEQKWKLLQWLRELIISQQGVVIVILKNSCILHLFSKVYFAGFADGGGKYLKRCIKNGWEVWPGKLKE